MYLFQKLQDDSGRLDKDLQEDLHGYFPASICDRFKKDVPEHLLAREIALTVLTNRISDNAGAAFLIEVQRETGRSAAEIAHAYLVVDRIFESQLLREQVAAHDPPLSAEAEYQALLTIEEANRRAVSWLLADLSERFESMVVDREDYQERLREYRTILSTALPSDEVQRHEQLENGFKELGLAPSLSARLADCLYLTAGLRISDIARETGAPIAAVTSLYYRLGASSYIHPLVRRFDENVYVGRWESLALRIVRNSLLDSLWALVARLVKRYGPVEGETWVEDSIEQVKTGTLFRELSQDMRRLGREEITIASLQVLSVRLARIVS